MVAGPPLNPSLTKMAKEEEQLRQLKKEGGVPLAPPPCGCFFPEVSCPQRPGVQQASGEGKLGGNEAGVRGSLSSARYSPTLLFQVYSHGRCILTTHQLRKTSPKRGRGGCWKNCYPRPSRSRGLVGFCGLS